MRFFRPTAPPATDRPSTSTTDTRAAAAVGPATTESAALPAHRCQLFANDYDPSRDRKRTPLNGQEPPSPLGAGVHEPGVSSSSASRTPAAPVDATFRPK